MPTSVDRVRPIGSLCSLSQFIDGIPLLGALLALHRCAGVWQSTCISLATLLCQPIYEATFPI